MIPLTYDWYYNQRTRFPFRKLNYCLFSYSGVDNFNFNPQHITSFTVKVEAGERPKADIFRFRLIRPCITASKNQNRYNKNKTKFSQLYRHVLRFFHNPNYHSCRYKPYHRAGDLKRGVLRRYVTGSKNRDGRPWGVGGFEDHFLVLGMLGVKKRIPTC